MADRPQSNDSYRGNFSICFSWCRYGAAYASGNKLGHDDDYPGCWDRSFQPGSKDFYGYGVIRSATIFRPDLQDQQDITIIKLLKSDGARYNTMRPSSANEAKKTITTNSKPNQNILRLLELVSVRRSSLLIIHAQKNRPSINDRTQMLRMTRIRTDFLP